MLFFRSLIINYKTTKMTNKCKKMTNKCELCDNCVIDNEDKLCYKCFGWKCCKNCGFEFVEPGEDYCSEECKPNLLKNKNRHS